MPPHSPASEHCTKMSLNLPLHLSDGSEEGGEVCVVVGGWGLGGEGGRGEECNITVALALLCKEKCYLLSQGTGGKMSKYG